MPRRQPLGRETPTQKANRLEQELADLKTTVGALAARYQNEICENGWDDISAELAAHGIEVSADWKGKFRVDVSLIVPREALEAEALTSDAKAEILDHMKMELLSRAFSYGNGEIVIEDIQDIPRGSSPHLFKPSE